MSERALLFIHALTGMHPGAGTSPGTIDLPVQRERHTGWPTIAASGVKGVLRDACRERAADSESAVAETGPDAPRKERRRWANEFHESLVTAFGPGRVDEASAHAGAIAITDARILAFPVRSARGVFAWITCSGVLDRFDRDLELAGAELPCYPLVKEGKIAAPPNSPLLLGAGNERRIVLEELEFLGTEDDSEKVADFLADETLRDPGSSLRFRERLCVLSDDDFTFFVRNATEVVPRIALNYETKSVRKGALFYQEFLPPETLLYSLVLAGGSRRDGKETSASEILDYLEKSLPELLQIGGDETTGKGLCATRLWRPGKEA